MVNNKLKISKHGCGFNASVSGNTGLTPADLGKLMDDKNGGNKNVCMCLCIQGMDVDSTLITSAFFEPNVPGDGPGGILYLRVKENTRRHIDKVFDT